MTIRFLGILAVATCLVAGSAWAGPAEEIAELNMKRGQAFSQGNAEAFAADFADNAVFTSSRATFRIEGKSAIRAYFAALFQTYPQRQSSGRHAVTRIYANDTIAVGNSYADQNWVDKSGNTTTVATRTSVTWVKIDGKWLTVDFHTSRVPANE